MGHLWCAAYQYVWWAWRSRRMIRNGSMCMVWMRFRPVWRQIIRGSVPSLHFINCISLLLAFSEDWSAEWWAYDDENNWYNIISSLSIIFFTTTYYRWIRYYSFTYHFEHCSGWNLCLNSHQRYQTLRILFGFGWNLCFDWRMNSDQNRRRYHRMVKIVQD